MLLGLDSLLALIYAHANHISNSCARCLSLSDNFFAEDHYSQKILKCDGILIVIAESSSTQYEGRFHGDNCYTIVSRDGGGKNFGEEGIATPFVVSMSIEVCDIANTTKGPALSVRYWLIERKLLANWVYFAPRSNDLL